MEKIEWLSTKELIAEARKTDSKYSKEQLLSAITNRLESETQPKDGETKGQFMYHKMSDYLNNTLCDVNGFVKETKKDHRTLQQSFFSLILKVVESFSKYSEYEYDGRNESSVRKAKIMIKALEDSNESISCPFI